MNGQAEAFGPTEITTFLDFITSPGLKPHNWLVSEQDENGGFVIEIEEYVSNVDPDSEKYAPYYMQPIRIQWNADKTAAIVAKDRPPGSNIDPMCTVFLHKSLVFGK